MSAADRIATLNQTDAHDLCARTQHSLGLLVDILSRETTLLRAGRFEQAATLTAQKTQAAQDYVQLARTIQRESERLKTVVPAELAELRRRHESLATQMAENLRVLATAKSVTADLIADVARAVGSSQQTQTYGAAGQINPQTSSLPGFAVNRAL